MTNRVPGEEWLSCINCDTEWDDTDALGDFDVITDCPECDGFRSVIRVFKQEPNG